MDEDVKPGTEGSPIKGYWPQIKDFSIGAEWHFFPTPHGKGPCNGLARCITRNASRTSLQQGSANPILTAKQVFEWAEIAIKQVSFSYVPEDEYGAMEKCLEQRLAPCEIINGTQSFYSFILMADLFGHMIVETTSESSGSRVAEVVT
ncbi:hypothetical protein QAD02_012685 [Eretmocerus hayati]|uniref:Uncharacterized protein n=1 Tax=Eretmocerus hayati TaxID=131215 RepID=A0ACC2P0B4_9HYME|nr:hypothetical protein QAD02_012685 [Eretmocerus hayati]